ncbi:MAG TPA: ABC transporter substrate-binding protein [Tepidisphaeraceae bacterium]|jgi:NitT/TauT family transport system substrate-binding protein|nr:ABC transporter substrate-binding protein [Tepidisphaeraceae bacterium]
MKNGFLFIIALLAGLVAGCSKSETSKIKLALNWKPEPEFGGFYAAQIGGQFKSHGLDVDITGGGDQVAQMLAAGQIDFGILAADEVVTARSKGIDLVALFAVYQTNPQGIMTHAARGLSSIADVYAHDGTLAVQPGLAYVDFLKQKYTDAKVKIIPYDYSIVQFMADPKHSQQCFVTSEPIAAKSKGGDPKVFLIAESGFNPYAAVVCAKGDYIRNNPNRVKQFIAAVGEGWRAYLDDPKAADDAMGKLNQEMDAETFAAAAQAQKDLIENDDTRQNGLGSMSTARWETIGKQLADLKIVEKPPAAGECFMPLK